MAQEPNVDSSMTLRSPWKDQRRFGPKEDDYIDFDHFVISRIEPGKIWLEPSYEAGLFGPISVPKKATEMLREGWEMSCALGRIQGRWRIMEMGSVYPL